MLNLAAINRASNVTPKASELSISCLNVTFPLNSYAMTTAANSPAMAIRRAQSRSFVHVSDLPGTNTAARKAASRAAQSGELIPVRRGLYFKAPTTRYGTVKPRIEDIIREIFRTPNSGFGPAGHSAAQALGITTQVPATYEASALRKVDPIRGATLHVRSNPARAALNEREIAILEVLRSPEHFVDGGMTRLARTVHELAQTGTVRPRLIGRVVAGESSTVRDNHARLIHALHSAAGKPARAQSAA
jgi:Family of unknown function (DUF6088)